MSERKAPYITVISPPATLDLRIPEAAFQRSVIELAHLLRYHTYHTHDSRRSDCGWPDLALLRPPRLILAELKSERGRLRPEQLEWLRLLQQCPLVETYLWRPSNWPDIVRILEGAEQPPALSPTLPDGEFGPKSAQGRRLAQSF